MIRRILLTLAASVLTVVGTAPAALAQTYTACDGVWVIVDFGSLGGGVSTKCATSYSTGTSALRGAGFTPTLDNGFLEKINGKPSAPNRQTAYWSYWQATRQSNGTYSAWKYSNTGANSSHPVKGNAEGWHYVSVSGSATPPGATPPKNPAQAASVPTKAPTKAPSSTKSSAAPTTKASAKPTAGSSGSASSSAAKPSASSAVPQTSSASPSPSGAVTSPSASSPTEAPSADPPGMDVPAGSPIAVIATTSALAVGAAGAGGWWLWKGRRR